MKKEIALVGLCFVLALKTQADESGATSAYDPKFVKGLEQNDEFDLEACKLAETKAVSPEVQSLAATEGQFRSQNLAELKLLVTAKNFPSPGVKDFWKPNLDKLNAKSGVDFDFAFLADLLFVRLGDRSLAGLEAKLGQDEELKARAEKIESAVMQDEATITRLMGEAKRNGATVSDSSTSH